MAKKNNSQAQSAAKAQPKKQAPKPIDKPQKPPSPVASMLKHKDGPKWSLDKLEMNQYLSMTSYMTVVNIGDMVSVRNQYGSNMQMSKELLESMYSATHYSAEVALNMTGLAELLMSVQDVVFSINFKKQASEAAAVERVLNADASDFTDKKKSAALAKALLQGQDCSLLCHMVEVENNLGRSLVIDLQAPDKNNKFRQVDHRTIESIIFKNKKYVLKSGGKNLGDIDTRVAKDEKLWDANQLAVGNVFSGASYYKTVTDKGSKVLCYEKNANDRSVTISKSIMTDEMYNADVWDSEEAITMT